MINGINSTNINGMSASSVNGVALVSEGILFTHTGVTFNPLITLRAAADIRWEFSDGSTSSALSPVANFGTATERETKLIVSPWTSLQRINIGYGHDDGGSTSIEDHPVQAVTDIGNLELVAESLGQFCASRCPLRTISFRGFSLLDTVELYSCPDIDGINYYNTPSLARTTFENSSNATPVDFSLSPNIADIRFSRTHLPYVIWGDDNKLSFYHLCCWSNTSFTENIPWERFPFMREVYNGNNSQTGLLAPSTDRLSFFYGENNAYTSADFTGCYSTYTGTLRLYNNLLETLIVDDCAYLVNLDAHNNNLNVVAVDAVLVSMDNQGASNGTLDLSGNSIPTASAEIASLESKGWEIIVDS